MERTRSGVTTDQLFVCYDERVLGAGLSKQRFSHWIVDTITTAYLLAGSPVLGSVVAHSTRGAAASWALLRRVPLADICAAASWASSCIFARHYRVNVAPPSAVGSAVLGVSSPYGDCARTSLPHRRPLRLGPALPGPVPLECCNIVKHNTQRM